MLICVTAVACALSSTWASAADADDKAANETDRLTVRDTLVLEGSNFEPAMNARSRVDSTLPRALAGRRSPVDKPTLPMPLGLITFEGTPESDIDVLVEYDGRVMTHLPAASSRSKRLLWGRLTLTPEPTASVATLPPGHWLTTIDFGQRLAAQGPSTTSSRFLLYDIEHKERPLATIEVENDQWIAKNTGRDPIHFAAIFRPTENGQYQLGLVDTVEGYRPNAKQAKDDAKAAKAKPDPEAVKEVGRLVSGLMNAVTGKPTGTPAKVAKVATAPVEKNPGTRITVKLEEPADGIDVVRQYVDMLPDLGDTERAYLIATLSARALKSKAATFVYQLDTKTLERIVPIEVTPQPDRLLRTGIVLVTDADPSLSAEVDRLIAQLGDESWTAREQAEARLRELGRVTERNLANAQSNGDAEIVYRAKRILADLKAKKP